MTLTRMEMWSDSLGHTLDMWYDGAKWPRAIESKDHEYLEDVAAALATRHGLVQVGEGEWRAPETQAGGLDLDKLETEFTPTERALIRATLGLLRETDDD